MVARAPLAASERPAAHQLRHRALAVVAVTVPVSTVTVVAGTAAVAASLAASGIVLRSLRPCPGSSPGPFLSK